jgi:hypothetical protein
MKISPAGGEIFHADGQTDRHTGTTKLIVVFRHIANAPSKSNVFSAARYVELRYITLNANKCLWVPRPQDQLRVPQKFSRAHTCLSNFSVPWDLFIYFVTK